MALKSSQSVYNQGSTFLRKNITVFKIILKSWMLHINFWIKAVLIIAIMVMSATGALMIRLKKGPLDLEFAKPYIEAALSDKEKKYEVKIDTVNLIWPEVAAPLLLDLTKVDILQDGTSALTVNNFSFSVSGLGLLKAKILPSRIIISNPEFKIFSDDGSFNAFWETANQKPKEVYGPVRPKAMRESVRGLLTQITDPKNQELKMLSALKTVQIKEAVLKGAKDERLADISLTLKRHNLGLAGDLSVKYPEKQSKSAVFKSEVLYRTKQEDLTFTAKLQDLHSSHVTPFLKNFTELTQQDLFLNGDVKAAFNKDLKLQMATIDLNLPEGKLNLPKTYDVPLVLNDIMANIIFDRENKKIELHKFSANVAGVPIQASIKGRFDKGNIVAPVNIKIAKTTIKDLRKLLSTSQKNTTLGAWIGRKVSKANISNFALETEMSLTRNKETRQRDFASKKPKISFDFTDLTVQYHPTLQKAEEAIGSGTIENDVLNIHAKSGKVGKMTGRDVTVKIANLSIKSGGIADINVNASGPLKGALDYISDKPISAGSALSFDVNKVKGNIDFNVQLDFPTIKGLPKEKIKVKLKGVVTDVALPNVVRDLSVTGGPYDLKYENGATTFKGKGKLSGRDVALNWTQYVDSKGKDFKSKIEAKLISDAALRQSFGIRLDDYLSGAVPVDVTYIDMGSQATLDVKGDLTPATLTINPFKYNKPENVTGTVNFKGLIKGTTLTEINKLYLDTKDFSLSNGRLVFKSRKDGSINIAQGSIPAVTLGKTSVGVDFEIPESKILKARVNGSVIDISPFLKTDKKSNAPSVKKDIQPIHLSVNAKKMIAVNGNHLSKTKLYLELNNKSQPTRIEMDADVGKGAMYLRFKPDATGARNFSLNATDAGATLKAFGLYDKMRGGEIDISGKPKRGEAGDDLYGKAFVTNFAIRGAPVLAKLASAMSLQGASDLVNNEGLTFKKLASDFEWKFQDSGNLLVLKDGRTSGSSLGLTFEGVTNMKSKALDLEGTVIPLSGANKVIGQIPIIGDILTGGDALFAATYKIKGSSSDPKITVNPLSVLAPGFLRKILFEGDLDKKVKKQQINE